LDIFLSPSAVKINNRKKLINQKLQRPVKELFFVYIKNISKEKNRATKKKIAQKNVNFFHL